MELFSSGLLFLEKGLATFTISNGSFMGFSLGNSTIENGMWDLHDKMIQLLGE